MRAYEAARLPCDVFFDGCVLILVGHMHRFIHVLVFLYMSVLNKVQYLRHCDGRKDNSQPSKQCIWREILPTVELMCATYYL